jgi:hypothetical protein
MAKVRPFHTVKDDDKPRKNRVYHDDNKCPAAQDIKTRNLRLGKEAAGRLCKLCQKMH